MKPADNLFDKHRERNSNKIVKNDHSEIIGRHFSAKVSGQKHETIEKSSLLEIGQSLTIKTGGLDVNRNNFFKMQTNAENMGKIGEQLDSSYLIENNSKGDFEVSAEGNADIRANGSANFIAGQSMQLFSGKSLSLDSREKLTLDAARLLEIASMKQVMVRSASSIRLTTGKASIEIDKSGKIKLNGTSIEINGGASVNINGSKISLN